MFPRVSIFSVRKSENILLCKKKLIKIKKKIKKNHGCTLAGSYSEGATLSQFIILAHKGEKLV